MWLRGDFHPANVVTSGGALSGVVDFGEMCAGDPAADLSAAWLPAGSAPAFFAAYGGADSATVARARGWAVLRAVGLIGIGRNGRLGLPGGKPSWEPAGAPWPRADPRPGRRRPAPPPAPARPRHGPGRAARCRQAGRMFWLTWKKLSGS